MWNWNISLLIGSVLWHFRFSENFGIYGLPTSPCQVICRLVELFMCRMFFFIYHASVQYNMERGGSDHSLGIRKTKVFITFGEFKITNKKNPLPNLTNMVVIAKNHHI